MIRSPFDWLLFGALVGPGFQISEDISYASIGAANAFGDVGAAWATIIARVDPVSAVEGLRVAEPALRNVVPTAHGRHAHGAVRRGALSTERIGGLFGPAMLLCFGTLLPCRPTS